MKYLIDDHDPYPHVYVRVAHDSVYVLKFDEPGQAVTAVVLWLYEPSCDRCAQEWSESQMKHSTYRRVIDPTLCAVGCVE